MNLFYCGGCNQTMLDPATGDYHWTGKDSRVKCGVLQDLGPALDYIKLLQSQIEGLGKFILENVPGEPSQSEGAVDCAIRILRKQKVVIKAADEVCAEFESMIWMEGATELPDSLKSYGEAIKSYRDAKE